MEHDDEQKDIRLRGRLAPGWKDRERTQPSRAPWVGQGAASFRHALTAALQLIIYPEELVCVVEHR